MSRLLYLLVAVLSLVAYFCSFTSDASGLSTPVDLLLAGGLLAALDLLPKTPDTLPFATLLSSVGGLAALSAVIEASGGTVPTIAIIILILGLVQFAVSVVALLMEHGVIKLAPKQAVPYQPQNGPSTGSYQQTQQVNPVGQGGPHGQQQGQQPGQQGQYGQAQGGQPGNPPQSTQFMQQPGQLGQPGQPGTPPGGFGSQQ
ncbi:MAG TPA: DUF5336 domain-containing protein [Pseudonocardiaceae bacterium]|jgi:hypothetical protein|nr:DUF5336 domain-containing protein [Pseudonocardiaceae bacterium]